MLIDNMLAYAEIDEILNLLDDNYTEKIPENIRNFFKEEKNNDYIPRIDTSKSLIEQNLKRETFVLLAILNLNYWCENEREKQEFLNQLVKNEKEKKELEEKYNPDNLFKNKEENSNESNVYVENLQMVEYKQPNFIQRLLEKIAEFFRK